MKKINKKALDFLSEIAENNNREWFAINKQRYLDIKKDIELFWAHLYSELNDFDESLQNINSGPYMFRIYHDARFAKGRPYKQNYGILIADWWKPSMHNRAGYFLNIEPWNSFIVWGAYMPDPDWLKNMRNNIIENPDEIKNILNDSKFSEIFKLEWKKLKTAPRWFAKDHPEIDLLRYKSIYAIHYFTDKEVLDTKFFDKLVWICKILYPFDQYLNKLVKK